MTNKEAIKHLEFLKIAGQINAIPKNIDVDALNLAIDALESVESMGKDLQDACDMIKRNRRLRGKWLVKCDHDDTITGFFCSRCGTQRGQISLKYCAECGADLRDGSSILKEANNEVN